MIWLLVVMLPDDQEGRNHFAAWCRARGKSYLPAKPGTVLAYLRSLHEQGEPRAALFHRLRIIGKDHRSSGAANPAQDPALQEELLKL